MACRGDVNRCSVDDDCETRTCIAGVCVVAGDGGAGGQGGGGASCTPACPASAQCIDAACTPRYRELRLTAPPRAGNGPARISAHLIAASSAVSANDPPALMLDVDSGFVSPGDGGVLRALPRSDAGHYEATVYFSGAIGGWQLFASFPDAGLSAEANVAADFSAPRVQVSTSSPPSRLTDGGPYAIDVDAPLAFRRDESITVVLDSIDPDFSAASLEVTTDAGVVQRFDAVDGGCASAFDGGRCLSQRVDLWRHPMLAFRQDLAFTVRARDDVGNERSDALPGRAQVTRYKWTRREEGLANSMALTARGHLIIYFIAGAAGSRLTSWTADGTDRWSLSSPGASGQVMVGGLGSEPRLYVAELLPPDVLAVSVRGADAPTASPLTNLFPAVTSVEGISPPLLVTRGDEVAYFPVRHMSNVTLFAWNRATQATVAADAGAYAASYQFLNPISDDRSIDLVLLRTSDFSGALLHFNFPYDSGFPPSSNVNLGVGGTVIGAAAIGENDRVFGTSDGGRPGGGVWNGQVGQVSVPLAGPGIAAGATQLYLNDTLPPVAGQPTLCTMPPHGNAVSTCVDLKSFGGAPVLGGAGTLYLSTMDDVSAQMGFRVKAVDAIALTPQWETPLVTNGFFARPRLIDCSRTPAGAGLSGRPGVLYVSVVVTGTPTRTLVWAIVVDSPGLDATAPWPMQTHDPRNTNNVATPLGDFACP